MAQSVSRPFVTVNGQDKPSTTSKRPMTSKKNGEEKNNDKGDDPRPNSGNESRVPSPPNENNNNKIFRLMDLPPEIRNEIYIHALTTNHPICLSPILHCGWHHSNPQRFKVPPLLRTNRQIRSETAGLFYANTTFLSHSSAHTFAQCLKVIDNQHLKFLKTIEYRTCENVWTARLWLQMVGDLLGERVGLLKEGVVKAAYDPGWKEGEEMPEVCWVTLSGFSASNGATKKDKDDGKEKKK
ncbi:hypothetical protein PRZ48_014171 [Zasmidium cellare]|uniref:2EXR domain-containing protein n=1 Tax=Zasmidium cellare TaxID=395010 RepID=A0ABR0E0N3_ZASCE|nr:hypothetical protein PRZ48_014171 [Zasmidium cellare]